MNLETVPAVGQALTNAFDEVGFRLMRCVVLAGEDDDLLPLLDDTIRLLVRLYPRGHATRAKEARQHQPGAELLDLHDANW